MHSPTPDPIFLPGGPVGVLMIHGFTGSPSELRPVADALHAQEYTVSAPLLAGHGTIPADLNKTRWQDWLATAELALADLQKTCETIFVAGQSMGGLLTLNLAMHHDHEITGAIVYSPAVILRDKTSRLAPIAKYFVKETPKGPDDFVDKRAVPRLWDYAVNPIPAVHELLKLMKQTRRILPQVTCPLLILHSTRDQIVDPASAQLVYDKAGSTDKEILILENSGHVITLDAQWETVAEQTKMFILRHVSPERSTPSLVSE
jgi:carboxylesterase